MKIKSQKYNVMATFEGAPTGVPSEIPTELPPELEENGDSSSHASNGCASNGISSNGAISNGSSHGVNGALNGINGDTNGASGANGASNGMNGSSNGYTDDTATEKKSKRKNKKVSFGFDDDVKEIPARERTPERNSPDIVEESAENGLDIEDDEEEDKEDEPEDIKHKNSDIEFLRKFANLRKLGMVMEERSKIQEMAEREQVESELARARQILQKQTRRQELARLIPGEELERLLSAVNMQEEFVVSRDDARKFMLAKRGKTSYIYLAGKDLDVEEEEQEPQVKFTQSEDTFSETFSSGGGLL